MSEQISSPEIELLKAVYSAVNRNDVPSLVNYFHPEIEWTEPVGYPQPGTYRGHAEVIANISRGRNTWAEGQCEPERFLVSGDKVIVFLHVRVRLKDHTEWIDAHIADVYTFRNGRPIQMRSFANQQDALRAHALLQTSAET